MNLNFHMSNEEFLNYLEQLKTYSPQTAFFLQNAFVEPYIGDIKKFSEIENNSSYLQVC